MTSTYKGFYSLKNLHTLILICLFLVLFSCGSDPKTANEEQLRITTTDSPLNQTDTSNVNGIQGNLSFNQITTDPNAVVLTGMKQHRLVTVYKVRPEANSDGSFMKRKYDDDYGSDRVTHYMPGFDLLFGYNLLAIAHYDLTTEKLNFLFDKPVLIKSLYYPSFEQDSIEKKPVNRNHYMVSVYDEDTNRDTLINRLDLRRFYSFNVAGEERVQLVPPNYSVERSQYDSQNDVMYIYARLDANQNGKIDKKEPQHIFWINLRQPDKAKRMY
jgi:hypothetical protein